LCFRIYVIATSAEMRQYDIIHLYIRSYHTEIHAYVLAFREFLIHNNDYFFNDSTSTHTMPTIALKIAVRIYKIKEPACDRLFYFRSLRG
jgi:hypothetical protein